MIQIAGGIVLAVIFLALLPALIRIGLWLLGVIFVLGVVWAAAVGVTHDASQAGGATLVAAMVWFGWYSIKTDAAESRAKAEAKRAAMLAKHEAANVAKYGPRPGK